MSHPDRIYGLSADQVRQRIKDGQTNAVSAQAGKSTKQIVISNTFTYFNFIFAVITVLLCIAGSFKNLTFLPIVIGNTLVGIFQELRAKKTLDKMKLLNAPHATVIRDGTEMKLKSENLVLGDIVIFAAGDQICADAQVIEGSVTVNEALLTGEQDEISKEPSDSLLSGSFVTAGKCLARLERVGNDSYISKLTEQAKVLDDREQSEMIRSINKIVKWMGIILIPIGALLFYQARFVNGSSFADSVASSVAAVIGMIPEGLYLLTTVALALGTIRLAKNKVLLNDMKSIEALARVDVLCVDKTGTITEPKMQVNGFIPLNRQFLPDGTLAEQMLKSYVAASRDTGATMDSLRDFFESLSKGKPPIQNFIGQSLSSETANQNADNIEAVQKGSDDFNDQIASNSQPADSQPADCQTAASAAQNEFCVDLNTLAKAPLLSPLSVIPFSSSAKYGAAAFKNGTWILGAPEFVFKDIARDVKQKIAEYTEKGYRVLIFAFQSEPLSMDGGPSENALPAGIIIISNAIRKNAPATFRYFKNQGVTIKVISGDNPATVSEIAKNAGIDNYDSFIDASLLDTEQKINQAAEKYTVFGRVTPRQKQLLVKALKAKKHTVAMTGDGVNDILAMKDADCGIAMASGSEAVSQAANVVLLDSDFACMPKVVGEGRRVVNNIRRSASLFLVKNIFSLLLSVISVCLGMVYPLEPSHISLTSMFTIGLPGFLLALESNNTPISGHFLKSVLMRSLPAGITDAFIVASLTYSGRLFGIDKSGISTAATLVLSVVGFMIVKKISTPLNSYRLCVLLFNIAGMLCCFLFIPSLFSVVHLPANIVQLVVVFSLAAESLLRALTLIVEKSKSPKSTGKAKRSKETKKRKKKAA